MLTSDRPPTSYRSDASRYANNLLKHFYWRSKCQGLKINIHVVLNIINLLNSGSSHHRRPSPTIHWPRDLSQPYPSQPSYVRSNSFSAPSSQAGSRPWSRSQSPYLRYAHFFELKFKNWIKVFLSSTWTSEKYESSCDSLYRYGRAEQRQYPQAAPEPPNQHYAPMPAPLHDHFQPPPQQHMAPLASPVIPPIHTPTPTPPPPPPPQRPSQHAPPQIIATTPAMYTQLIIIQSLRTFFWFRFDRFSFQSSFFQIFYFFIFVLRKNVQGRDGQDVWDLATNSTGYAALLV